MENKNEHELAKLLAKEGIKIMSGAGLTKIAVNAALHFGFMTSSSLPMKACVIVASYFISCEAYNKGTEIAERELDEIAEIIVAWKSLRKDMTNLTEEDYDDLKEALNSKDKTDDD